MPACAPPPTWAIPVTVLHDACATFDLSFGGVSVPAAYVHAAMMVAFEFGYARVTSTRSYLAGA